MKTFFIHKIFFILISKGEPAAVTDISEYSIESWIRPKMSFLRLIAIANIFWYNVQNHAISGMNKNGHTWFSIGTNEAFSHFIQHKNHVLEVEKISSFLVGFVTECALRCTTHVLCLSFNIKEDNTENSRQITCELLPTDLYNASRKLQKSREDFHHWSAIVRSMLKCFPLHCTRWSNLSV